MSKLNKTESPKKSKLHRKLKMLFKKRAQINLEEIKRSFRTNIKINSDGHDLTGYAFSTNLGDKDIYDN